jgi:hypothetical protein
MLRQFSAVFRARATSKRSQLARGLQLEVLEGRIALSNGVGLGLGRLLGNAIDAGQNGAQVQQNLAATYLFGGNGQGLGRKLAALENANLVNGNAGQVDQASHQGIGYLLQQLSNLNASPDQGGQANAPGANGHGNSQSAPGHQPANPSQNDGDGNANGNGNSQNAPGHSQNGNPGNTGQGLSNNGNGSSSSNGSDNGNGHGQSDGGGRSSQGGQPGQNGNGHGDRGSNQGSDSPSNNGPSNQQIAPPFVSFDGSPNLTSHGSAQSGETVSNSQIGSATGQGLPAGKQTSTLFKGPHASDSTGQQQSESPRSTGRSESKSTSESGSADEQAEESVISVALADPVQTARFSFEAFVFAGNWREILESAQTTSDEMMQVVSRTGAISWMTGAGLVLVAAKVVGLRRERSAQRTRPDSWPEIVAPSGLA